VDVSALTEQQLHSFFFFYNSGPPFKNFLLWSHMNFPSSVPLLNSSFIQFVLALSLIFCSYSHSINSAFL
jgi:hypothetical protein